MRETTSIRSVHGCTRCAAAAIVLGLLAAGCGPGGSGPGGTRTAGSPIEIRVKGSDTMIQLATAWAEAYREVKPNVFVSASGGGSGTGFAALQNNNTDICMASRELKLEEGDRVKAATGKDAKEITVAVDALAVYAHPSNPIDGLAIEELREIWAERGTITTWEQIDRAFKGRIVLFGRQNSSGTYDYFREHVCGKTADGKQREFRGGISEMNGSAEVVENVARTPAGLGYSGMGYKTSAVKWLRISDKKGELGIEPCVDMARIGKYPVSRKLHMYTAGEPRGEVKAFIDWVLSPAGQALVSKEGFVPVQ